MGRHSKPKSRKGLKITGAVLASTLTLGGATAGYMYWNLNHRIQENSVDIGAEAPPVQPQVIEEKLEIDEFTGAFNILLIGNDDGNGDAKYGSRDHALNDVNILLHVSADHTKATAISVPRDMFVDAPTCTNPETNIEQPAITDIKINQTLSRGGLKCVVDTFREMTGEQINYAAMIQFNGVIALSNAVGGVPVCTTADIVDPESGLQLSAGTNTIAGEQALAFLRTRHGVGDGSDLARISNQQVFLSSLMKTLKSKETLADPAKIYAIANAAADNMTLSTNLASIPTLASLAYSLKDIPLEDITFIQYPTEYVQGTNGSSVKANTVAADEMIEAVFNDKAVTLTGGTAPGSIGAEVEEESGTPSANPSVPAASAAPTTVAGTPSVPATTGSASPSPTATESRVELSADVTGMTAAQNTCSRAFGDY